MINIEKLSTENDSSRQVRQDDVATFAHGQQVTLDGESHYRIANSHLMPEFFMSLVGPSDHWMFVSSCGAVTAGRRDADNAIFPYATDDQISIARLASGPRTWIQFDTDDQSQRSTAADCWTPFAQDPVDAPHIRRNLYKTPLGNKLVLEEVDEQTQLVFRYRWTFSERFGLVRTCHLENNGPLKHRLQILDGLVNVLPYGLSSEFMMRYSNLGNAYKKSELLEGSEIGVFYLSSIPTDRAEPSEALQCSTVWQTGLSADAILLSTEQLPAFKRGDGLSTETEIRGRAGAFLVSHETEIAEGQSISWHMIAEVSQDHGSVIALNDWLQTCPNPEQEIKTDIESTQSDLIRLVSSVDGIQLGSKPARSNRHLSNTIFNTMRGGLPIEGYTIRSSDFRQHVQHFNLPAFDRNRAMLDSLPDRLGRDALLNKLERSNDPDLIRLGQEYLPFAFSRRHGDPTRPWNRFSIDLRTDDGDKRTNNGDMKLSYEGNWRDIFQNWEALSLSYPKYLPSMICRFLNATTADGYNPYRLTKQGFEWEEPSPEDPWANIGYWGDHQIIYLLKLLEWNRRFCPDDLPSLLNRPIFVHANVPYRIRPYQDIREDPQSTIDFDASLSETIGHRVASLGADGRLLTNRQGEIQRVTLMEKLLTLSLAKMSNFIPDGGIWLNSQRPEWNDANNALVGNGLSLVTTCYLHRWFQFLEQLITTVEATSFDISREVVDLFQKIKSVVESLVPDSDKPLGPLERAKWVDALSQAGSDYRCDLYRDLPSGETAAIDKTELLAFLRAACQCLAATVRNNRREDGLYHTYNLMRQVPDGIEIDRLYEMLEGQVAILSAGLLSPPEADSVLKALRKSRLYRSDQQSYLLYPNRNLPTFLQKNRIGEEKVRQNPLIQKLLEQGDQSVVKKDHRGDAHFHGRLSNSADVRNALSNLDGDLNDLVEKHGAELCDVFEQIHDHQKFTGRSGTFFAYEGLGSIYWHMVSKLGLAVSENYEWARHAGAQPEILNSLKNHLAEIRAGIGAEKSPSDYGAFPSDPYSHTPEKAGVKQPGMTGQVKEDVLARFSELGILVHEGQIQINLELFDSSELLNRAEKLEYYDVAGQFQSLEVPQNGFGFTLFQVPILYLGGETDSITIWYHNGETQRLEGRSFDTPTSERLFSRDGTIDRIECRFAELLP